MNREEKQEVVLALQEKMQEYGNFYIADTSGLSVEKVNNIRRKCFESGIEMKVELISASGLRVFKSGKLFGIPESKFYLKAGVVNVDHIDGCLRGVG